MSLRFLGICGLALLCAAPAFAAGASALCPTTDLTIIHGG
jgi:hypothetical protein